MAKIEDYEDIIGLPRPESKIRKRMPLEHRAAQFASFAALSGYEERIAETARITSQMMELSQEAKEEMSRSLADIMQHGYTARIIYFEPDKRKEGGEYKLAVGTIRKLEEAEGILILSDKTKIPLSLIISISRMPL